MDFQEKLATYAQLLVCEGLNVQEGQVVNITGEIVQRNCIEMVARAAYKRGAKYVNVDFIDPVIIRTRIVETKKDSSLCYVPRHIPVKYEDFIEESAAVLRFVGSEEPDILADLPPEKVNAVQKHHRESLRKYYEEGVGKSKVQWTVAAAATPRWAKKVYPELNEKDAYEALWNAIFASCRADREDCIPLWKQHNKKLHQRAEHLTKLKIHELHFIGPGTDLKVYLSKKALFKAGGSETHKGVSFEANIPTEECFTTPDHRHTTGKVRVTRPVLVNGKLVKDLQLEFTNGVITHFTAAEGKDQFGAYIANDAGACRLGEVALVGIDSPIYQSGRIFQEILFDENAACHIAVGFAYRFCLDGGASMTTTELENIGCNDSLVHTDFMISSDEVDVIAKDYEGNTIPLIKRGSWV